MTSMSVFGFKRKSMGFDKLFGIRARLVLLALILVAPLMLERARSLEDARSKQIALAYSEISHAAQRSAENQREAIASLEMLVRAAAHMQASKEAGGFNCNALFASLPVTMPLIRNLTIVGKDGRVKCATRDSMIGLDLSDRSYLTMVRETRDLVFSDFLISKSDGASIMIAAYPVSALNPASNSVIVASVNLSWMSKIMNDLGGRPGLLAVLVDSTGTVLAAPSDRADMIGLPLKQVPALSEVAAEARKPDLEAGTFSFDGPDGSRRMVNFAAMQGTQSRLILSIDEAEVAAEINRDIRTAYLQLGLVCLFVLIGALVAAKTLIIRPINSMVAVARQFGQGEWTARAADSRLPAEFVPLAHAFDSMAAQLAARERDLIASNDRLTVMASIDVLSGLANRRAFQSRLNFEWMKALQQESELSLLMIDVDHFKLFNDTYGHLEGDACLSRLGEQLQGLALATAGFAARYGGEEFCMLLPNTGPDQALEIGERVRATIEALAVPHATSSFQTVTTSVGVASVRPNDHLRPIDLIEAADASLYAAKRSGRNMVAEHGLVPDTASGSPVAIIS